MCIMDWSSGVCSSDLACPTPAWLPGGHLRTLYGALAARYHRIAFVRERVETPDGDFLDFDWAGPGLFPDRLANGQATKPDTRLAGTAARRWMQDADWASKPSDEIGRASCRESVLQYVENTVVADSLKKK